MPQHVPRMLWLRFLGQTSELDSAGVALRRVREARRPQATSKHSDLKAHLKESRDEEAQLVQLGDRPARMVG